ncbi:hypothetical protein GCM10023155_24540 [Bremerella cremea]
MRNYFLVPSRSHELQIIAEFENVNSTFFQNSQFFAVQRPHKIPIGLSDSQLQTGFATGSPSKYRGTTGKPAWDAGGQPFQTPPSTVVGDHRRTIFRKAETNVSNQH